MQFDAQDSYYRSHYPDAQFDIIEIERIPAGRLYIFASVGELRVIDIALLPQYRNRGIGGSLMQTILRMHQTPDESSRFTSKWTIPRATCTNGSDSRQWNSEAPMS